MSGTTAITWLGATLLDGIESGVWLAAVVCNVQMPGCVGVNCVVQVITPPTAKLATGIVGVHPVVSTATGAVGALGSSTEQVAPSAASGPLLVHVATTVTGVPTDTVCVGAPVAIMSATWPAVSTVVFAVAMLSPGFGSSVGPLAVTVSTIGFAPAWSSGTW